MSKNAVSRHSESRPTGSRHTMGRLRTALAVGLVLAGTAGVAEAAWIHFKAGLAQVLLAGSWRAAHLGAERIRPWPWADTWPVARLSAPAQKEEVLVLAGATGRTLAFGPGWVDGSASRPGHGHALVTGHRDTHFRFLERVRPGDPLDLEAPDGTTYRYVVRDVYVAEVDTLDLDPEPPRPRLTLITCFPFGGLQPGGPLRWVVTAELAKGEAARERTAGARSPRAQRQGTADVPALTRLPFGRPTRAMGRRPSASRRASRAALGRPIRRSQRSALG